MTRKEFVEKNYPKEISFYCNGGVCGCPFQYKEMAHLEKECDDFCINSKEKYSNKTCTECWNKEYICKEEYKHTLTEQDIKNRMKCGEDSDCTKCSCYLEDDCKYNHVKTTYETIKKMDVNELAIYLHSFQAQNYTIQEIYELLLNNIDN